MHNLSKALCKFFTLKGQCHKICHPFSVKKLPWPLVNRPILYDFENEKFQGDNRTVVDYEYSESS